VAAGAQAEATISAIANRIAGPRNNRNTFPSVTKLRYPLGADDILGGIHRPDTVKDPAGAAPIDRERQRRLVEEHRAARVRELLAPGSRTAPHFERTAVRPSYFPVDTTYRVPVTLEPAALDAHARRERVTGETEHFPVVGLLRGSLGGQPFALEAARMPDGVIQVDFRDATSGSESYAFRYLPVEPGADTAWWLDFNFAQNPLCAYGDGYRCVLPPSQNTLTIPIRAGERRFR
jgi:uncharacterized protein (DUF1684 family)